LLGFERVVWLDEVPGIQRDPRVDWPTDRTVVNAVVEASRGPRPFFVFAFPSSTHSPYSSGVYRSSDLGVPDVSGVDSAGEVKEYVNALHLADREIGALIKYFSQQPDSTIIVILGDHLPPLSQNALRTFWSRLSIASQAETSLLTRRVPLVVWANFPLPREDLKLSANALPSYILNKMGMTLPPVLSVTDAIRQQLPVVGQFMVGTDGHVWDHDSLPDSLRALVSDYRLLQYDLLLGRRYSLESGRAKGEPW
jgi:arylsulfatase A-like enzyme